MAATSDTKNRAFVQFVKSLQRDKPDDLVQIFDRKTFYTVYGEDAKFVAKEYNKTDATLTYLGGGTRDEQLPSQSINTGQLRTIVKDLLHKRMFKVEVWACKPNTSSWVRLKKGSPGNTAEVESYLFESDAGDESGGSMAMKVQMAGNTVEVGVACADVLTRTLFVAQFPDRHNFVAFESAVVQSSGVKECLVCAEGGAGSTDGVHDVLERCGVAITEIRKAHYNTGDIEQDLTRLLGSITGNLPELELRVALASLAALIKYLDLLAEIGKSVV
eukprot:TRINITY_DN23645_c0_g1_i1.p1 TRINITY_DN23645_c0_g1~~TRINITY_DN23645_c0_g1_i1.p1  ORF type:complete len:281 (+),score=116.90 TRINITY_DN23645_c0_g1_i1:24-845(+)